LHFLEEVRILVVESLQGRADHLAHRLEMVIHALFIHEGKAGHGPEIQILFFVQAHWQEPARLGQVARGFQ
jgi:hypothetical protein